MGLANISLLDDGFDAAVRDSYAAKGTRIGIAVVLAAIAATGLGWQPMLIWFAVVAVLEGLGGWVNHKRPYPLGASRARRINFMVQMVLVNGLWLVPSAMMWMSGSPPLQMAAVVQWLANLFYVALFSSKSRLFAFLSTAPQILVIGYFGIFMSPFHGWAAVTPTAILVMALLNAARGVAGGVEHHEKLVAAVAAREASEAAALAAREASENSERRFRMAAELVKMRVWEFELPEDGPQGEMSEIWQRVHPEDRADAQAAWMRALATGTSYTHVHRLVKSGRWVESVAEVFAPADGKRGRVIGGYRDVEAERQAELALIAARDAAEAANEAKSTFLATMSHEIRTPLNGVLGMAQAMAAGELSDEQRVRLNVVRGSGETLLAILNDVLDLSKIEAGKVELESVAFDLGGLLRAVHAPFATVAEEKGLSLSLSIDPAALGRFQGDPTRIRQVLTNLVSNALKFTEEGSVDIRAGREGETVIISVKDSGMGIAADRQAALFESFVQADASTTRRFGGTGLGLAICSQLVGLMGGAIAVESALGEGATFTVRLPLPHLGAALDVVQEPVEDTGAVIAAPLKILAAEDNLVNQLVLTTLLEPFGWTPVIVGNGQDAVDAMARETWDIVLMDMQMPIMDGEEAVKVIRAREAESGAARTPVIALTANTLSHQVQRYLANGFDEVVAKPIQLEHLVSAMMRAMEAAEEAQMARSA